MALSVIAFVIIAITVVSYNGISQRANTSAASSCTLSRF